MASETSRALLVVADEATPAGHPAEGPLHDPAPREDMKPLRIGAPDDLDDEVEESRLVHQPRPVVARIREKMLEPRPAFPDSGEDCLGARAV